ncbi:hypothetical protein GF325_18855 [Candidatus Bathyarchaeota archaeon]|nr:hypothetical protein [Candidatus Bathyarchaeota archaeon]
MSSHMYSRGATFTMDTHYLPLKTEESRKILDQCVKENTLMRERVNKLGWTQCIKEINYHLLHVMLSIDFKSIPLFRYYLKWSRNMIETRNEGTGCLIPCLEAIIAYLHKSLTAPEEKFASRLHAISREILKVPWMEPRTLLEGDAMEKANQYLEILLHGTRSNALNFIMSLLNEKMQIKKIMLDIIQPVQMEIGRLWELNQITTAQEHYATAVSMAAISQFYPIILNDAETDKVLIAGTVGNEIHEIGIRMVADFFEMDGWNTYYLGSAVPIDAFIKEIKVRHGILVAISVTIPLHLYEVKTIISSIRKACPSVKILVGGFPLKVDKELWKKLDADGFALDAAASVKAGNQLVGR